MVAEEIYSTLYLPEGDLYSMVLKAQWLGMTFAVLKQMVFLKWECKGTGEILYEEFREILCVLIRRIGISVPYMTCETPAFLITSFMA